MDDRNWDALNEQDFDTMLESSVSELPPDDIVAQVVPWKKAMNRVLIGMVCNAITLNFWYLEYILPAVGMVLSLLGFRTLRHENRWLRGCYAITVIRAAYLFWVLILNTTILPSTLDTSKIDSILTGASIILLLLLSFCLWRGLRAVQQKAGLPPRADGAAALMIWYALMYLLAVVQYSGLIIIGGMFIGYVFILRSLYQLSGELDEAGYAIQAAPVKMTDRAVVITIVAFFLIGSVCGYLFGGSYPMDWTPVDPTEQESVEDIKAELLALGFPEYALNDLSTEDIAACKDALRVVVDVTDMPVNEGRKEITEYENFEEVNIVYDVKELHITGIGVQIPGERESWIIFHHFLWTIDPGFYGTESIHLWPVYQDVPDGWSANGDVTGRVLYDKNGETFTAAYAFLGSQNITSNTIFWGTQTSTDIFANFSMPSKGENYRCYVAYPIIANREGYVISSWIDYKHQKSWLQYPVMTAMETSVTGSNLWESSAFVTITDALQYRLSDDGVKMID